MRIKYTLFFLFLPFIGMGKKDKKKHYAEYYYSYGRGYFHLKLFADSTFIYRSGFKLGDMQSDGRWRKEGNTLKLLGQQMPWKILKVEEQKIDTVKNKIKVTVITTGPDSLLIQNLPVWVNNNCDPFASTNKYGTVEFHIASATRIYFYDRECDEYVVKDSTSNHFVVTLDGYPIYNVSPKWITWKEWSINKRSVSPIECGKILEVISLKRRRSYLGLVRYRVAKPLGSK